MFSFLGFDKGEFELNVWGRRILVFPRRGPFFASIKVLLTFVGLDFTDHTVVFPRRGFYTLHGISALLDNMV